MRASIVRCLFSMVLCAGCGGDRAPILDGGRDAGPPPDVGPGDVGSIPDLAPLPDGYGPLAPCSAPGEPCVAPDPCVIAAICGPDLLCHPVSFHDCDDGLDCTVDSCKGLGVCENVPKDGTCALTDTGGAIVCFEAGDRQTENPCMACDPTVDKLIWSPATGGACDDGDTCTKDDYCVAGQCKGTDYGAKCSDNLPCTEDACDGKGGCLSNALIAGWCLINGVCHKDGDKDPSGACNTCDVAKSQISWTPIVDACQIPGGTPPSPYTCYASGDLHPGGCAQCDPTASKTSWTVTSGCLIGDTCYQAGEVEFDWSTGGCGVCDPSTSQTGWTPAASVCTIQSSCYASGASHPGGCAQCDPAQSATGWTVTSGCLIQNTCYAAGAVDLVLACRVCDPKASNTGWSLLPGKCLINMQCYDSGAVSSDGCGTCDPSSSGTGWTPLPNKCLIDNLCYASGAIHPQGCATCDPSANPTGWTVTGSACLIDNQCKNPGDKSASGCGVCDPTKDKTAWTPVANTCLIGGDCYQDGAVHPSGCLICDAAASPTAWTPTSGVLTSSHDFESGTAVGWTITNSASQVGWQVSSKRAAGGAYALYYGDPVTGNYNSGSANSGSATMPAVALTAGKKAALSFMLYMHTEPGATFDVFKVVVGKTVVWEKDQTAMVTMQQWKEVHVDLSGYAGQSVTIGFEFNTVDGILNDTEGIYIDDVMVYHGC